MPDSDEERFSETFNRHYSTVLAYLYRRTGDFHDAEELAAAAFAVAWRRLDQLPEEPATRAWLIAVARRSLSNHWRGRERWRRLVARLGSLSDVRTSVDAVDEEPPEVALLRDAFGLLRPSEQELLRLVDWEGVTHAEAAQVLGCSIGTFDVRVHRARASLRKHLEHLRNQNPPTDAVASGGTNHAPDSGGSDE